ncbi:EAL domain-containing protein [Massilia sp. GCM10020059]|uniref:EAL domain-containing protein n=1 Tax=Massilia agrisoli TaxID=2892444 RepID=A0ABS8IVV2_9BURK|nr:EAL domain-containing protein [Massilia agrisoli]
MKSIGDGVVSVDAMGRIEFMNEAASKLTGWGAAEALGRPAAEVICLRCKTTLEPLVNPLEIVLQRNAPMRLPVGTVLLRRDGKQSAIEDSTAPIHDHNGMLSGAVMLFHDVTSSQQLVLQMAHLASHDVLTDLPNRAMLDDRIRQAVAAGERNNGAFAVLYLDLDRFKRINDSLGHAVGDLLLCSVADRLRACVRNSDTVCRQGGDEFLVLLADQQSQHHAAAAAEKILAELGRPHEIGGHALLVSASIGISVFPDDGHDAATLIKNADTAMYRAKAGGRCNAQFYKHDMNLLAVERQQMEADLRHALEQGQFVLYYQVKVELASGRASGAEALLRWEHPQHGTVGPERFLPVAEDVGLIVPLGRWVLKEACAQARRWQNEGVALETMAVNVSAQEFRRPDFADCVREVLRQTGLAPGCLELEISESSLMRDVEASNAMLSSLKDIGVRLAVDDFGTGYSSLSCLTRFPLDALKIDRSFVSAIGAPGDARVIASVALAMGNALGYRIIAQGVEAQVQVDFLKARGCTEGQGFFFGGPLTAAEFSRRMAAKAGAYLR